MGPESFIPLRSVEVDILIAVSEGPTHGYAILKQAADEDWILFFEHDPRVAACRIRTENGRYFPGDNVKLV